MLEIEYRNGNWEASYAGGLLEYSGSLETLLEQLVSNGHAQEIDTETKEEE